MWLFKNESEQDDAYSRWDEDDDIVFPLVGVLVGLIAVGIVVAIGCAHSGSCW